MPSAQPFLMAVNGVFVVAGRGTVVSGIIETGVIRTGETVECVGFGTVLTRQVAGIELYHKTVGEARAGDPAGLMFTDLGKTEVQHGHVLAAPGTIASHAGFDAEIVLLKRDEGGRAAPIASGYRAQIQIRTASAPGELSLPGGSLKPGDSGSARIALQSPLPLKTGDRFTVTEGGRTIGMGSIASV